MKYNNLPPSLNRNKDEVQQRIFMRIIIVVLIFLVLNVIAFLPPVHARIKNVFFSEEAQEAMLKNNGIAPGKQDDDEAILKSLQTCLVTVEQEKKVGAGIIWDINDNETVFVTARHAITDETKKVLITFFDQRQAFADVVYLSEHEDLAFLSIPTELMEKSEFFKYTFVKTDLETFQQLKMDSLLICFRDNKEVIRASVLNPYLFMEDFNAKMIWAEAYATPGMSGSGVFDISGNFQGILCGGNEQNEIAVLPITTILDEYEMSGRMLPNRMNLN